MGESRAALKCLESAINDLRAWTADTDVVFPIELACEVVDAFDAWKDAGSGTDSIPKSTGEEVPPPPPGFTGERNKVIGDARDGAHTVRLVEYAFPDGSRVPYAELHETHDGARPGRVMALSALVHLAQNVTDLEVWAIGNRDERPAEATSKDERAQAERWARLYLDAIGCEQDADEGTIAAMLPLARDARKPIDDAHVALDVEVPRQVNGRALSLVERIEILLRGQAYASDLFDKASDERDAARREIERLSKEREELLAEATAATNQISDMHAEIARLRATPAPLTEAACVHCSAVLPDHSPICVVVGIARDEGFPTIAKAYERYASRGDIPDAVRAVEGTPPAETACPDCGRRLETIFGEIVAHVSPTGDRCHWMPSPASPPPAETVTTGELWTPKVRDRVVTVSPLTASLTYRDEANAARRAGATGNVAEAFVDPLGGPDDFMVRHDDGTFAPYDADELLPVPKEST